MDTWSNGTEITNSPKGGPRLRGQERWRAWQPGPFQPKEIDIHAIRERAGMSRIQFARCFGIPVETLRHWERGDRKPRGAALVLLHVIERDPRAIIRSLGSPFHIPFVDPDPPIRKYRKRKPR